MRGAVIHNGGQDDQHQAVDCEEDAAQHRDQGSIIVVSGSEKARLH